MSTAAAAMSEAAFDHVKAGDRVWLGTTRYGRSDIRTVAKVTRTQIVVDWHGTGQYLPRFYKNGYQIGASYLSHQILGVATPEECAEWDAAKAREHKEWERKEAEKAVIEAKRGELFGLFATDSVWVSHEKGTWSVNISGLTEEQVRAIAGFLQEQPR